MMNSLILVLDFGSQYTQLIARRLREYGVYTEIVPYFEKLDSIRAKNPKGIILSGGPASVYEEGAYKPDSGVFDMGVPVLGICYGMQYIAHFFGGSVVRAKAQEFGKAVLEISDLHTPLFENIKQDSIVWMSHADKVESLPSGFVELAKSGNTHYCAIADFKRQIYALQFHPEVVHSECGGEILKNFAVKICGADTSWNMRNFAESEIVKLREKVLGETCGNGADFVSILETPRTYLREYRLEDAEELQKILDEKTMYAWGHAFSKQECKEWIEKQLRAYKKHGFGLWTVVDKASGEIIGNAGLNYENIMLVSEAQSKVDFAMESQCEILELGYIINHRFWGQGLGLEVARACAEYAFSKLGVKELYCLIKEDNKPSLKLAKKLGMRVVGKNIKHYKGQELAHFVLKADELVLCADSEKFNANDRSDFSQLPHLSQKAEFSKVLCAVSGGVDSSVVATLLYRAIGENLIPVFVDTGLLRKGEREAVEAMFRENLKVPLIVADAKELFLGRLKRVTEPEQKRKIIGETFIEVFEKEAKKHNTKGEIKFLAQGTLYPDVIESVSVKGPSKTIKSHHNVGGLPEWMKFELIEPLRELFKDEVRALGRELGMPESMLMRHPFPGPGLAIRIMGEVNAADLEILKEADSIFIEELHKWGLYDSVWQAFCVLLNVRSVGVMGDNRTYDNTICIRAVEAMDGMTASFSHLPHAFLESVSNRIINEVAGINRVVYDITSKPPGTIEWE
ncbi:glutamine-hydrolyzing GMP synthase [Campylobacter upsaliensis]|nr:glutamine-hydrolyzing GMP synthase [Campylobacter upsaliensis]EAL3924488.1 glutamine-hydrolyzing GMP synthase [Campylobacter upsaliensis]EMD1319822.1 glutamine-hydrolyzing GMP synthase [Campylobacter upsaliensis]